MACFELQSLSSDNRQRDHAMRPANGRFDAQMRFNDLRTGNVEAIQKRAVVIAAMPQ
jgi:hypothetical protein